MNNRPIACWSFACALAALLGLAGAPGASAASAVTGWRAGDHGTTTRFVLDLTGPVAFKLAPGTNPDRLRIDLPDTVWQLTSASGGARPDGLIGAAEFTDPPTSPSVTLWLKSPARVLSATLVPPSEGFRYRLVIDLQTGPGAAPAAAPPPPPPPKPAPVAAASPPPPPAPKPQAAPPPPKPAAAAAPAPAPQVASAAPVAEKRAPAAPPPPMPKPEPVAETPPPPPPIAATPAAAPEPVVNPGPPLALRAARVAIEVPPPPFPPAPPPPSITPRAQAAPVMPPPLSRRSADQPPPPATAPLPRITSTPLAIPPPLVEPTPAAPAPALAAPAAAPAAILPATAQLAALPPIRIVREPGRPVMVILPIPPAPPKPLPAPAETRPLIVLDPGHGGIDPGATGLSGVHEKAVTLAFALELKRTLEATGRYRVLMTREDDSAVALRERVRIARAAHADLFLSIHADALSNRGISGLSVYTESDTASDREAEALATKENKADLIAGIDLSGAAPEVTSILIDLAQRETHNRSGVLAGELVQALGGVVTLLPRTHRSAGFAVLTAPDVPSVLLELGYLSNKADERGLTSPEQRGRLAAGIQRAIDRFFAAQPMLQRS